MNALAKNFESAIRAWFFLLAKVTEICCSCLVPFCGQIEFILSVCGVICLPLTPMNLNFAQHSCAMNVLHASIFPYVYILSCREATEMSCYQWPILQSFYQTALFKIALLWYSNT